MAPKLTLWVNPNPPVPREGGNALEISPREALDRIFRHVAKIGDFVTVQTALMRGTLVFHGSERFQLARMLIESGRRAVAQAHLPAETDAYDSFALSDS